MASIAAPLVVDALKGITGQGAPQLGMPKRRAPRSIPKPKPPKNQSGGLAYPWMSPPFFGNWPDQTMGAGKKKAPKKKKATVYF